MFSSEFWRKNCRKSELFSICLLVSFQLRYSECDANTVLDSSLTPLQLPRPQVEKLAQLFEEKNISLQFDINQQFQTECLLFKLESVQRTTPITVFKITTSTVHNYIQLEFRTNVKDSRRSYKINAPINDGEFHKIIITINGDELTIVENCHQLLKTSDDTIAFGPLDADSTKIFIATDQVSSEENGGSSGFHGQIREFTAGAGDPLAAHCAASLERILDNPVHKETFVVEHEAQDDDSAQMLPPADENSILANGGPVREKFAGEQTGRFLADSPQLAQEPSANGHISRLTEKVDYLERQINHWNSIYDKFDGRVKRVELHLRGCQVGGRLLTFGERHQNLVNCTECQCSSTGDLHCGPIGCPKLDCAHPVHVSDRCCPHCGRECLYNGRNYESGEEFWPKQCVRCICDNGRMECQFKQTNQCPLLECAEQETPPNQCCPVCTNVDYCAPHLNPCDLNANCHSGQYSAKCTCKTGFFGNGTICYDIDECLWDESAREQLGGCRTGTICINLPGSFKCDCLPGFQKLDEKNCLDRSL